jgi:hypothetical protein
MHIRRVKNIMGTLGLQLYYRFLGPAVESWNISNNVEYQNVQIYRYIDMFPQVHLHLLALYEYLFYGSE